MPPRRVRFRTRVRKPCFRTFVGDLQRQCIDRLACRMELPDHFAQLGPVAERGVPEGGDVAVQLHHQAAVHQPFHDGREGNDAAAGERLDEQFRPALDAFQPVADMRDQPCLAARIAQRAALRHRGDIDRRDGRNRDRVRAGGGCRSRAAGGRRRGPHPPAPAPRRRRRSGLRRSCGSAHRREPSGPGRRYGKTSATQSRP